MAIRAILISVAAISVALNVALVSRLQSVVAPDISYILEPESGSVWQLETHAEFMGPLLGISWLPQWAQAPIRIETSDSLFLAGHLTPITKECDWRRIERYGMLQRTCFRHSPATKADRMTIVFEAAPNFSRDQTGHPVVALVAERVGKDGRQDKSPKLVTPILMTNVAPVSRWERQPPEPRLAVLFRGWAARNFEIATAMEPPRSADAWLDR